MSNPGRRYACMGLGVRGGEHVRPRLSRLTREACMSVGRVSAYRHGARLAVLVAAIVVLPSPLTLGGARSSAQSKPASEWTPSVVPKAQCGPGEPAESGL